MAKCHKNCPLPEGLNYRPRIGRYVCQVLSLQAAGWLRDGFSFYFLTSDHGFHSMDGTEKATHLCLLDHTGGTEVEWAFSQSFSYFRWKAVEILHIELAFRRLQA